MCGGCGGAYWIKLKQIKRLKNMSKFHTRNFKLKFEIGIFQC